MEEPKQGDSRKERKREQGIHKSDGRPPAEKL